MPLLGGENCLHRTTIWYREFERRHFGSKFFSQVVCAMVGNLVSPAMILGGGSRGDLTND